jgi:hypothetical protein
MEVGWGLRRGGVGGGGSNGCTVVTIIVRFGQESGGEEMRKRDRASVGEEFLA